MLLFEARMDEKALLERITYNPQIFGGKPIIRGHRLAVEHVLGVLAAGDTIEIILSGYPCGWNGRTYSPAWLMASRPDRVQGHLPSLTDRTRTLFNMANDNERPALPPPRPLPTSIPSSGDWIRRSQDPARGPNAIPRPQPTSIPGPGESRSDSD